MRGMIPFVLAFGIAFVLALILTPTARVLGRRLGLVDTPGGRRQHQGAISRLGGIGLYFPFALAILGSLLLPDALQPPRQDPKELIRLAGLLIGCTFMFLIGLIDDRRDLPALPQYAAQLAVSLLSIPFLIIIERVMNPFTNDLWIFPMGVVIVLTVVWIMGMVNTVNFLDGVDGLAAGVAGIVCVMLTIHMLREGQISVALLPLALLGAILGFLPFNFAPAKVFMGSTGSFFLGYAVAALSIISGAKMATILLIMGIPIVDVAWLIFSRWRAGQSVGMGDRRHLHHRLLDIGLKPRQIVLLYYLFCIIFGTLALTISNRIYKLIALLVLGAMTVGILILVNHLGSRLSQTSTDGDSGRT